MYLDFEKPISELEEKLASMKKIAGETDTDVQDVVKALEKKILKLKKDTFSNLTRWQRVQLSRHPDLYCRVALRVPGNSRRHRCSSRRSGRRRR